MDGRRWGKCIGILLLGLLNLFSSSVFSQGKQEPEAQLLIVPDAIDVGRPFSVKMEIFHPEDMVVIFPDSTDSFGVFELESIQSFPTRTFKGVSTDQVLYQFWCFDINPMQGLQLPFRYIVNGDTLSGLSNVDSVRLEERVKIYNDTLSFKPHTGLTEVKEPKTWLIIIVGLLIFLFISILFVATLLLIKPIKRRIQRWRMEKAWKLIVQQLNDCKGQISDQKVFIDTLNGIWKGYLSPVWGIPLKPLTTPEIESLLAEDQQTFSPKEIETFNQANRLADTILYAELDSTEGELERMHTEINGILHKEHQRRMGGES